MRPMSGCGRSTMMVVNFSDMLRSPYFLRSSPRTSGESVAFAMGPRLCQADSLYSCHWIPAFAETNYSLALSRLDHGDDLAFGQHVVDIDQDALDLARRGRGDRDFHLHRLHHHDILAVADADADAGDDRTHPAGNFGLDLHFSHLIFLLLILCFSLPLQGGGSGWGSSCSSSAVETPTRSLARSTSPFSGEVYLSLRRLLAALHQLFLHQHFRADDVLVRQPLQLSLRQAEHAAQNLLVVFAERRRRKADRKRLVAFAERQRRLRMRSDEGAVDVLNEAARVQ